MSSNNPNALALMQTNEIEMIRTKADILIKSGFLPEAIKTPEQAIAIIFYGRELNVPDWTALKHISVVKGTPQTDGQLTLALIQRSGLLEKFVIERSDTKECRLLMKRKGQEPYTVTCTFDEAGQLRTSEFKDGKNTSISLTEKYNWKQQPKTMLFYFTVKQGARRLFSDVLNGMAGSLEGELFIEDGGIVENATFYETDYSDEGKQSEFPEWWNYLTEWAFQRFEFTEDQVANALVYAPNWRDDKRVAMAAVLALHCGYDAKCADEYTSANGFSFETYDAAAKVIEEYQRRLQIEPEVVGE